MKLCICKECNKLAIKKGYCNAHYHRFVRYGDANVLKKKQDEMHGMSNTHLYKIWDGMIGRCERSSDKWFYIYGGRGIKVCSEWRNSFLAFYNYIGEHPGKGYTIERIDTNGNYEPGNVRWATPTEQNMNQRLRKDNKSGYRGVSVSYVGKTKTRYVAKLFYEKKNIIIGYFDIKEEAAYMYDQYALQLYGNYVKTNFEYL